MTLLESVSLKDTYNFDFKILEIVSLREIFLMVKSTLDLEIFLNLCYLKNFYFYSD